MAVKNINYPFVTGEDLKNSGLSNINVSFSIKKLNTGLLLSAIKLKQIISANVYNAIMDHYNSSNYEKPEPTEEESKLDNLVHQLQFTLAPFAFLESFIWNKLNVGNHGITAAQTDDGGRMYKYESDEAKNNLFRTAWTFNTELIDALNAGITEGEGETVFHKWKESSQYKAMQNLVIRDYKDFNEHYYIDNNAAFFIRCLGIQSNIINEDIAPRIKIEWEDIPANGETPAVVKTPDAIIKIIKDYIAHKVVSKACFQLDAYYLPDSIRNLIENEHHKKTTSDKFVKERLSENIKIQADLILSKLDLELAAAKEVEEGETYLKEFEDSPEPEDKFYFSGL